MADSLKTIAPPWSSDRVPPVGYRFIVTFFIGGVVPNPVDIAFRSVSGISSEVVVEPLAEGGQNLYIQQLPKTIKYGNLVLERGMLLASPLGIEFNVTMSSFQFLPSNVFVALLNENNIPISAWLFMKAYPVKWEISGLDADQNGVAVDKMELAFTSFLTIRV